MTNSVQYNKAIDSDSEEIAIMRGHRQHDKVEEEVIKQDSSDRVFLPIPTASSKVSVPKKKLAPKTKKKQIEDLDGYAFEVINRMKDIYRRDNKANKEGMPATLKIEAVDDIYHQLMRKDVQEACMKLGALHEVRTWLEPLPDNSLPNQKIKKVLLELLYCVRTTKSDLLSSGVGKIVHFYSKNRHESKDIRKMAINIMNKWKAMIIKEELEE